MLESFYKVMVSVAGFLILGLIIFSIWCAVTGSGQGV